MQTYEKLRVYLLGALTNVNSHVIIPTIEFSTLVLQYQKYCKGQLT